MTRYDFGKVSEPTRNVMRGNKKRDTKPELALRRALFGRGLRYRIHYDGLPGTPDIVFTRQRVAIFCDGDFWHGKDWESRKRTLKKNRDYWIPKIERNIQRDRLVRKELEEAGWTVLRFWESQIRQDVDTVAQIVQRELNEQDTG